MRKVFLVAVETEREISGKEMASHVADVLPYLPLTVVDVTGSDVITLDAAVSYAVSERDNKTKEGEKR